MWCYFDDNVKSHNKNRGTFLSKYCGGFSMHWLGMEKVWATGKKRVVKLFLLNGDEIQMHRGNNRAQETLSYTIRRMFGMLHW